MKVVATLLAAATLAVPTQVWAQDVFPDVEYIQGRTGFPDKIKGKLVLTAAELQFVKNDSTLFSIPMEAVKDVTNSLTTDPGGVGRKLLFGAFASKREEFLYVNTETSERAEAIVFKCHKKNSSPDMMAKIKFQIAKAKPATVDTAKH